MTIDPVATVPEPRAAPEPAYPVPTAGADSRFTRGLAVDVAEVLVAHGYPQLAAGGDWVELQQSLFRFLYGPRRL